MSGTVFTKQSCHGTCWELPLVPDDASIEEAMIFEQLSPEHSPLHALYTTNVQGVAEQFASEKLDDPETHIEVIVEGHTALDNAFVMDFKYGGVVEFQGKVYNIEHAYMEMSEDTLTRKDLHEALKEAGYDGFVMQGDYKYLGKEADDIAILEADRFTPTSVRMKIDNKWTKSLSIEEAREQFKARALAPYLEQGYSSSDFAFG